jgi:hypothetical protein
MEKLKNIKQQLDIMINMISDIKQEIEMSNNQDKKIKKEYPIIIRSYNNSQINFIKSLRN